MQSTNISTNKRIAKNTIFMYFRMLLLILIQLYSVPIILKNLGMSDYGLNQVVGGFVTMFSFVSGSLISGSQRFMSFAIGKNDRWYLKQTFDSTLTIFIIIAISAFIIIEFVGVWFLNFKMNIPTDRVIAANWVLQFSIFTFIANLFFIPFNADLIAHEKMSIYAYVSIVESILKLLIALSLSLVFYDKLIIYSLLLFLSSIIINSIYYFYNKLNFFECNRLKFYWDRQIIKDLGSYAGWNVIGSIAIILRNQGVNILMNIFYGTLLNAAHAIANQISGLVSQFINNIYITTRPQMVKLYAQNKYDEVWMLINSSTKYTFYLMGLISIPIFLEIPFFLKIWLKTVPEYTSDIIRILIVSQLIETLSNQLIGGFQAANKIKKYQSVSSIILLMVIPISYIALKNVHIVLLPYYIMAFISCFYVASIIYIASRSIRLNLKLYIFEVVLKSIVPVALTFLLVAYITKDIECQIMKIFTVIATTIFIMMLFVYLFGINNVEKKQIELLIKKIFKVKIK